MNSEKLKEEQKASAVAIRSAQDNKGVTRRNEREPKAPKKNTTKRRTKRMAYWN